MNSVVQLHGGGVERLRRPLPPEHRTNVVNALYGVADYLVQPLGMLLATPFLLNRLGASQYGLWMLAMAVIAGASVLSIGLGDATLRYVALYRGQADQVGVARVVRTGLTINLILGGVTALLIAVGSHAIANHVFLADAGSQRHATLVLRLASFVVWVRSIEIVLVNTLRAYEQYGKAVKVSSIARALTILTAVGSAAMGYGVIGIIAATLAISISALVALAAYANVTAGPVAFAPLLNRASASEMIGFSGLMWLQAVSGIAFSHGDRLMIGGAIGLTALAHYSVCVQGAQPIHGVISAALHFLFPHLSARLRLSTTRISIVLAPVVLANVTLAALLCALPILFSKPLLSLWMGPQFAASTWRVFAIASLGFGLLSLNVTAHYALLALGQVRYVSSVNVIAGIVTLLAMWVLIPRYGILGAALGRLIYGPFTWLMYYRLYTLLSLHHQKSEPMVFQQ